MKFKILILALIVFLVGCGGEPPHKENMTLQFEKAVYLGETNGIIDGLVYHFKIIARDNDGYLSVKEIFASKAQIIIDGSNAFADVKGAEVYKNGFDFIKADSILVHLHDKSDIDFSSELK